MLNALDHEVSRGEAQHRIDQFAFLFDFMCANKDTEGAYQYPKSRLAKFLDMPDE